MNNTLKDVNDDLVAWVRSALGFVWSLLSMLKKFKITIRVASIGYMQERPLSRYSYKMELKFLDVGDNQIVLKDICIDDEHEGDWASICIMIER